MLKLRLNLDKRFPLPVCFDLTSKERKELKDSGEEKYWVIATWKGKEQEYLRRDKDDWQTHEVEHNYRSSQKQYLTSLNKGLLKDDFGGYKFGAFGFNIPLCVFLAESAKFGWLTTMDGWEDGKEGSLKWLGFNGKANLTQLAAIIKTAYTSMNDSRNVPWTTIAKAFGLEPSKLKDKAKPDRIMRGGRWVLETRDMMMGVAHEYYPLR